MVTGALLIAFSVALGGPHGDATAENELARLAGVWSFQLVEVNGEKQPDVPFDTHRMILLPDGSFAVVQGSRVTRGTIAPDPAKLPMQYRYEIGTGAVKGMAGTALYELDGDDLRLCLPIHAERTPAAMASSPDCDCIYQIFRRETTEVREALVDAGAKELVGEWTTAGDGSPEAHAHPHRMTIAADGHAFTIDGDGHASGGTIDVDATQDPKTIDVTFGDGEMKGQTALGIYRLEGDVLTVCHGAPGAARPSDFIAGEGTMLATFERANAAVR